MFTIVSVYNDRDVLDRYLLRSLDRQTKGFELRLIDNTKGAFASAAEALNYGAKDANGGYLIFVHQDVSLAHRDWLESAERTIKALPDLGMAGVAGKRNNGNDNYSNAENAPDPRPACHNRLNAPVRVQTIDECLTIVPRPVFQAYQFNTELRLGWHLYAIEYSLRMSRYGLSAYVIPEPVYHWAGMRYDTRLPKDYFDALGRLLSAYPEYKRINTTCGDWSHRLPASWQRWQLWHWLYKVRPIVTKGDKLARIAASLSNTSTGRKIVRRCMRENNNKAMFDISRDVWYSRLRASYDPLEPLDELRLTASDINEHLITLEMLAREFGAKRILELGVDSGQSTLAFLCAVRQNGGWLTSMDIVDCPKAKARVRAEGLNPWWEFIEADDMTYPTDWSRPFDHIFIDTSHRYDHTLAELEKFEPWLRDGGILTIHDTISYPGVRRAIDRYIADKPHLREYQYFNNHGLAVIFKSGALECR